MKKLNDYFRSFRYGDYETTEGIRDMVTRNLGVFERFENHTLMVFGPVSVIHGKERGDDQKEHQRYVDVRVDDPRMPFGEYPGRGRMVSE